MLTYLIIGFFVLLIIVQDIETFFVGLVTGKEELKEDYPDLPTFIITGGLALVTVLMFILWPVTVVYLMHRMNE